MAILKPLEGEPLTYCFIGGEVFFRGLTEHNAPHLYPISREMAASLRETYADEIKAAFLASDPERWSDAMKLWRQLGAALDQHDEWQRAHRGAHAA